MKERDSFAVVVGSSGGIGRETARLLEAIGFEVLGLDRVPGAGTQVLDITERGAVREAVEGLGRPVDALVVSAAVHGTHPVEYLTDPMIDRILDVNLNSHIKLVRDFLPAIRNGGAIVGVSSIAACVGVPMSSLYSASKAGLEGFYESLRTEIAYRGIRVSLVQPGNVNTGFNETGNTYEPTGNTDVDIPYRKVVEGIDSGLGMAPEKVAGVIVKAVTARRPKVCYVVGMNALKAHAAKKLLGRDLAVWLMGKFFGF